MVAGDTAGRQVMGVFVPQEKVQGGAHGECAAGPRGEWAVVLYCDPVDHSILREGRGVESSFEKGFSQGAVELRLKGVSGSGRGGEGVQKCPVFWAEVEG